MSQPLWAKSEAKTDIEFLITSRLVMCRLIRVHVSLEVSEKRSTKAVARDTTNASCERDQEKASFVICHVQ